MLKVELPANAVSMIEGKFEILTQEGKAWKLPKEKEVVRKKHDGSGGAGGFYTKSYTWQPFVVHVKETKEHPKGNVNIKFCYDDRPVKDPDCRQGMVKRGFIRFSELGLFVIADTILAGGLLQMLGMSLADDEGNIDTERLTKVISAAIKYVDGEAPSDIKLIIDKE
jgi:hypothetical protein